MSGNDANGAFLHAHLCVDIDVHDHKNTTHTHAKKLSCITHTRKHNELCAKSRRHRPTQT